MPGVKGKRNTYGFDQPQTYRMPGLAAEEQAWRDMGDLSMLNPEEWPPVTAPQTFIGAADTRPARRYEPQQFDAPGEF